MVWLQLMGWLQLIAAKAAPTESRSNKTPLLRGFSFQRD
jgi:hypothetical protein